MQNELSPERARQVLDMLTAGGAMDGINTSLALRLLPLASELGDTSLMDRLMNHATTVAEDDTERGWARFEGLKMIEASLQQFISLVEEVETHEKGEPLAAALHHHIALIQLAEGSLDVAHATATRALRLREKIGDLRGMSYGYAVLIAVAKRRHDIDTAIALGTERLELLNKLKDHVGQMEAVADLAHSQATIGEFGAANDLFQDSLQRAQELGSLSGQLVARWGLADLAEIREDFEGAMLVLSDCLHAYMAEDIPGPVQVKQRIEALTNLQNTPKEQDEGSQ